MLEGAANGLLSVVDATNRDLATQLVGRERQMVMAPSMTDVARREGVRLDVATLAAALGFPVVPVVATFGHGLRALVGTVAEIAASGRTATARLTYAPVIETAVAGLIDHGLARTRPDALRRLEGGRDPASNLAITDALDADPDIVIAGARYAFVAEVVAQAVERRPHRRWSDRIDQVVLHRLLGAPTFLACMYGLCAITINVGGAFIDFFDILAGGIFVDGTAQLLSGVGAPDWAVTLLAEGVGGGLTTVATFIPIIGCLFLVLTSLEDSGYMARAAFVMDRFLRGVGLPGKAFVPMILGFGCTIPAVMVTRTLDNPRDRVLAIMMAPFMSCGARLPVYALFAAAFFAGSGQNVVFALYLIGIGAAVLTGLMLRHTLLQGRTTPFVMELPPYRLPRPGALLRRAAERLWSFIEGAGRIIVAVVVVLTFLNAWGTDGSFGNEDSDRSMLSAIGRTITPAFAPMGLDEENWPATVGLFTGILAKEAVVGTLDALYTDLAEDASAAEEAVDNEFSLMASFDDAAASIRPNLEDVVAGWTDPLGVAIDEHPSPVDAAEANAVTTGTFGAMQARFDDAHGAFAYLLMILLYAPCLAAVGAIWREAGPGWALFAAGWDTGLGYAAAVVFYQAATFARDPVTASLWILSSLTLLGLTVVTPKRLATARAHSAAA